MPAELDTSLCNATSHESPEHFANCISLVSGDFQVIRNPQIPHSFPRRCQVFASDKEIFSCFFPGIIKANLRYCGAQLFVQIIWQEMQSIRLDTSTRTADGSQGSLTYMYTSPAYSMGNHIYPYGQISCLAFPRDSPFNEREKMIFFYNTASYSPPYPPGEPLEDRNSISVEAKPRIIYESENIQLRNFLLSASNGWGEAQRNIFPVISSMGLYWGEPFLLNWYYDRSASVVGRTYLPDVDAAIIGMRSLDNDIYSSLYRLAVDPPLPPCDIPITVDPQFRDTGHFCMSHAEYNTLMTRFPQMNQNINTTNNLLRESL